MNHHLAFALFTSAVSRCWQPTELTFNVPDTMRSSILETEFVQWLTTEMTVGAVPELAIYAQGRQSRIVRFGAAKQIKTLKIALVRLAR